MNSPGLRAQLDHLALIDDDHTLPFVDRDHRAVGQDVVLSLGVGAALVAGALLPLGRQHVFRQGITVYIFAPLVRQRSAKRADGGFDKSHFSVFLLNDLLGAVCTRLPWYRNLIILYSLCGYVNEV